MEQDFFEIVDDRGETLARDMTLETAITLVKALFEKYYLEDDIAYIIQKQSKPVKEAENG